MLTLHKPSVEDLWFKEQLLQDAATMSYNHAYGGTIPFPPEKWADWHRRWLQVPETQRYYRYVAAGGRFVGEIAYRYEEERHIYMADVIIHAAFRNKGYGRQALLLLCQQAAEHGVRELYDDIASDNPAITLFTRCGFAEVCRTDTCITMKKQLLFP